MLEPPSWHRRGQRVNQQRKEIIPRLLNKLAKHNYSCEYDCCDSIKTALTAANKMVQDTLKEIQERPILEFDRFLDSVYYEKKYAEVIERDENRHGTSLKALTDTKLRNVSLL